MSRIGKKPIAVPKGVTVNVSAGAVEVKGPKGSLKQLVPPGIQFELKGAELIATPERDQWLTCMRETVADQPFDSEFKLYLMEQLFVPAEGVRRRVEKIRGTGHER